MNSAQNFAPLPTVETSGDAIACGRVTGAASKSRITHSLATYKKTFSLCDISWQQATEKAASYRDIVHQYSPHLLDELKGLSDGSGIDEESLMALNCRTEILPPDFLARAMATGNGNLQAQDTHANECTSLAFTRENNKTWLAQNWDWVGMQREALIVLHANPANAPAFITVTEAGMLAKIGINNKGFGVSLNILRSHNDGQKAGMPVHFLLRALLDCGSVKEACEFARQLPFASSSNIMIADSSGEMASLELSPDGCKVLSPDNNQLCHTNHFLDAGFAKNDAGREGNISTVKRLAKARSNLASAGSFENIKKLLSDASEGNESICRFADTSLPEIAQIETIVAVAMNLSEQSLFVSAAQPSITDFSEHNFSG